MELLDHKMASGSWAGRMTTTTEDERGSDGESEQEGEEAVVPPSVRRRLVLLGAMPRPAPQAAARTPDPVPVDGRLLKEGSVRLMICKPTANGQALHRMQRCAPQSMTLPALES